MTKHEDTTQAAGGSPLERGVRRLREGEVMGVYMDFDRTADAAWTRAEYLLHFGAAVSDATVQVNTPTEGRRWTRF